MLSRSSLTPCIRSWILVIQTSVASLIMPSVVNKPQENGASSVTETSIQAAIAVVEKKVRNLEKRKVRKASWLIIFMLGPKCRLTRNMLKSAFIMTYIGFIFSWIWGMMNYCTVIMWLIFMGWLLLSYNTIDPQSH